MTLFYFQTQSNWNEEGSFQITKKPLRHLKAYYYLNFKLETSFFSTEIDQLLDTSAYC